MMRAIVVAPGLSVTVEEFEEPQLSSQDGAIVRVRSAGICGSDLRSLSATSHRARPGHEFIGEVAEVGRSVLKLRSGDRVIGAGLTGCGRCAPCRTGDVLRCSAGWQVLGEKTSLPGAQADYVFVPAADQHLRHQGGLSDARALLLSDAMPTAWAGAQRAAIGPGDDVLVVGLGAVGLCSVVTAQELGARQVMAVDPSRYRSDRARRLGAQVLEEHGDSLVDEVLEYTNGAGASCSVDAVGDAATVNAAIHSTRSGGRVVLLGMSTAPTESIAMRRIGSRGLSLFGIICAPSACWPGMEHFMNALGAHVDEIVSHFLPFESAAEAYALASQPHKSGKVALSPSERSPSAKQAAYDDISVS